ncbi:MAG: cell division protein FtsW [Chloroflexus sp.]|jgi:cell division protein FtsW|uniref:putative lipid II flippase FtsW n=1 Tax=Chloroflexus sp. TaxID=1904827 RepID=UPI0021DE6D26|nr:putative lipid II flippase FtsW [Chloroflexus sp.]GIV87947.1 MAG: cell division protein FtsW [Chloroflexus sp.]
MRPNHDEAVAHSLFDRTTHPPDRVLLAAVCGLTVFGLVMVYSASFVEGTVLYANPVYYLLRQATGAIIGLVAMLVVQRIDYRVWQRYSIHLMAGTLLLLLAVLILPASMTEVNGSRSWIRFGEGWLGIFSIQPSEFAKLAMIIYFAHWLSRRSHRLGNVTYGLAPFAVILGFICGLVMLQPDLGTTIVMVLIGGAIFFAAGANLLHVGGAALLAITAFWALIVTFRSDRWEAFLDPWSRASTEGYQIIHSLYAFGSGGVLGQGIGMSRQKYLWLPQPHTDTIYAIVGEELGLWGTIAVLLVFVIIAVRGYRIAARAPTPFAALVAVGITSWLVFQAFINIAVTTGLIPFTGLTLPFLSYGSSSLISCLVAIGILLNISRHVDRSSSVTPTAKYRQRTEHATAYPLGWRDWRARLSGASSRRSSR